MSGPVLSGAVLIGPVLGGTVLGGTALGGTVLIGPAMGLTIVDGPLIPPIAPMVDGAAPLAALVLAVVFGLAAVTKAVDRPAAETEFAALGLPRARLLTRLVPPAEAIVAALLLWRPDLGAVPAAVALLAFTAVLAAALRSGRSVTCGCLGALSRRPVSPTTLVRNLVLIALAALAAGAVPAGGLRPTLPAPELLVASSTAALGVAVLAQLADTRSRLGRLWSVDLAGEGGPADRRPAGHLTGRDTAAPNDQTADRPNDHTNGDPS